MFYKISVVLAVSCTLWLSVHPCSIYFLFWFPKAPSLRTLHFQFVSLLTVMVTVVQGLIGVDVPCAGAGLPGQIH